MIITIPLIKFVAASLACVAIGWLIGISGTRKENGVLK